MEFVKLTSDTVKQQLINLRQIVFEVTDSCNLKCKYCGYGEFYGSYDKREERNLSVEPSLMTIISIGWICIFNNESRHSFKYGSTL